MPFLEILFISMYHRVGQQVFPEEFLAILPLIINETVLLTYYKLFNKVIWIISQI